MPKIRKKPYELTNHEVDLLRIGMTEPDYITDYFFRPIGSDSGWKLDEGFVEEGKWQKKIHSAEQKRAVIVGGFGSGKTRGIAMSACVWCITTQDFKFMNCAPAAWQSELMYKFIVDDLSEDTVFGKMIWNKPMRPYPKIELRFIVNDKVVSSVLEFMSVDVNAKNILSWEGDWVNIEEAGLIDDLEGTITNLTTRVRGRSKKGNRDRLARLTMITNSWDNPSLWYRYDLAKEFPKDYVTMTVSSRHNTNVTEEQLALWLIDIPEDEHERWIDAARPEGRGDYFSKPKIFLCEDKEYSDFIIGHYEAGVPGYEIRETKGCGVTYFHVPPVDSHAYILVGDPGIGNAPNRNAPVSMVFDVTDFPKLKASLVALSWGAGNGSIAPFYTNFLKFMQMYNPIRSGVDNTGPQRNTSEMLNLYIKSDRTDEETAFDWLGERVDISNVLHKTIWGLDFSSYKKSAYLISGRLMIESQLFTWPFFLTGMRSQLSNYDPTKDQGTKPLLAQDLVASFCMASAIVQDLFRVDPKGLVPAEKAPNVEVSDPVLGRTARLASDDRALAVSRDR